MLLCLKCGTFLVCLHKTFFVIQSTYTSNIQLNCKLIVQHFLLWCRKQIHKHRCLYYSPMGEAHMDMQCVRSTQGALAVLSEALCVTGTLNHLLLPFIRHQSIVSYERLKSHKSNTCLIQCDCVHIKGEMHTLPSFMNITGMGGSNVFMFIQNLLIRSSCSWKANGSMKVSKR